MNSSYKIYKGSNKLGNIKSWEIDENPAFYQVKDSLINAVNVAILLGKPLLVTGEPGTGKTRLAYSIAHELNLGKPLHFTAKTTSIAQDLLYEYDSLRHFHDANFYKAINHEHGYLDLDTRVGKKKLEDIYQQYIQTVALGEAIRKAQEENTRSVVLIDEIDKAPRDFPNDLLKELENMEFYIPEIRKKYVAQREFKPIVIITSNSEKLLPDAFLRRCVFYHIEFPNSEQLIQIAKKRLGGNKKALIFNDEELGWIVKHFESIREICRKKQPATAEFLSWVSVLDKMNFSAESLKNPEKIKNSLNKTDKDILQLSYSILAKHYDDLKRLVEKYTG